LNASDARLVWQIGQVVPGDDDRLRIEFADPSVCSRCRSGNGCGAGQFARLFGRGRAVRLAAPAEVELQVGNRVRVGIDARWLLIAAGAAYLVPLIALLGAMVLIGPVAGGSDAVVLGAGLAAIAASWLLTRNLLPGLLRPALTIDSILESVAAREHLDKHAEAAGRCNRKSSQTVKE